MYVLLVGWHDIISVSATDCAAASNADLCKKYKIQGYPTLKFFTPETPDGDPGIYRASYDQSVSAIKHDVVDFLQLFQESGDERVPAHWPNLSPFW